MKRTPDPVAFERMALRLRENCREWDALNLQLDELIAENEATTGGLPLG